MNHQFESGKTNRLGQVQFINTFLHKIFVLLIVLLLLFSESCSYHTKSNKDNQHEEISVDTVHPVIPASEPVQSDSIKKYSRLLKQLYIVVEPTDLAEAWFLPFDVTDRSNLNNISIISAYGAYRSTRVKGHKHSGVDIIPADKKNSREVYAVAKGVVCFINQEAPVKTVIIKHKLKDGSVIYSSYIHLKEIFIERSNLVDESTKIGVLYTQSEALKYGGNFDHLHFEIKKRIDDYSCASWLCMSIEELNDYFCNPLDFLKMRLKKDNAIK